MKKYIKVATKPKEINPPKQLLISDYSLIRRVAGAGNMSNKEKNFLIACILDFNILKTRLIIYPNVNYLNSYTNIHEIF